MISPISDDVVYGLILIFSVPFGHVIKQIQFAEGKRWICSLVGALIVLSICREHALHSVITALGNCFLIKLAGNRYCHGVSFVWCFGYLAFFRTTYYLDIPHPPALANAVQLLLTLRMVGVAFEIHDTHYVTLRPDTRKVDVPIRDPQKELDLIKKYRHINPSVLDIILYAYCYIGLMTGPYYKYRTYHDMLHREHSAAVPTLGPVIDRVKHIPIILACFFFFSHFFNIQYAETDEFFEKPYWFRLFYMVPMFIIFRTRLYAAWILSECMCVTAVLGAYPASSKPKCGEGPSDLQALEHVEHKDPSKVKYDFETMHNLSIYGCELAPTTREGLRSWNMTVQYWLAAYVHRRIPQNLKAFRVAITMGVSAFWHGIHPGYYLSFGTVPPILLAEGTMIAAFRDGASSRQQKIFDWGCWFFKMRGFDYMCMGFLLLRWSSTIAYWKSIYFTGHLVMLLFLCIGTIFKPRKQKEIKQN